MKQVRSDLVCHIGRVLPLLVTVLCEGVLLALPNPVEHPSASGWVPWYPVCRKPFDPKSGFHPKIRPLKIAQKQSSSTTDLSHPKSEPSFFKKPTPQNSSESGTTTRVRKIHTGKNKRGLVFFCLPLVFVEDLTFLLRNSLFR
jgi:hypothetical protein